MVCLNGSFNFERETNPIFIWSAPLNNEAAVHLPILNALFFNSLAKADALCLSSDPRHGVVPASFGSHSFRANDVWYCSAPFLTTIPCNSVRQTIVVFPKLKFTITVPYGSWNAVLFLFLIEERVWFVKFFLFT